MSRARSTQPSIPPKQSAGTLLYRKHASTCEVLIVHPSGEYNQRAAWSIPKGELDEGESPEEAARRETWEETGVRVTGPLIDLGYVDYRTGRKRVYCFAGEMPESAQPRCASWEIDDARFVGLEQAERLLHSDQALFIGRLRRYLEESQG